VFLPVQPDRDFEAIWALRCLVRGLPLAAGVETGIERQALVELADRMKSCRCGVVFFGLGLARTGAGHRSVEALLRLVADLNAYTRFHARRMRIPGDVSGADSVLCWQTGFPFSVNLTRGHPRYNPDEYSAAQMLQRREVDACLLVGSESVPEMPPDAIDQLRSIPSIVLDHPTVARPSSRPSDSPPPSTASICREPRIGWTRCQSPCGRFCHPPTPATPRCWTRSGKSTGERRTGKTIKSRTWCGWSAGRRGRESRVQFVAFGLIPNFSYAAFCSVTA
jgi:hypothetical protein